MFLILALFAFYPSFTGYEFTRFFVKVKDKIIRNYVLYENLGSFNHMTDFIRIGLYGTVSLLIESFIREPAWLNKLESEGILTGAYVQINSLSYTVGKKFIPKPHIENGYYIDGEGAFHYVYYDVNDKLLSDLIIGFDFIERSFKYLQRMPSWVLLYDKKADSYCTVYGNVDRLSEKPDWNKIDRRGLIKFIGIRKVLFIRPLTLADSKIFLVSQYPFIIGQKALILFGLIVIMVFTILLLRSIVAFVFLRSGEIKWRKILMAAREKIQGAIYEIDQEVSQVSAESATAEIEKIKSLKKLENDGIYVKKL